MYITTDGGDEYVHEIIKGKDAGTSVASTDTLKAGTIITETPDGRMRLMDYFNNVEKEISAEIASRKANIASVRAQMARDFEFNAKARHALHKAMAKQIAKNAAIAKHNLKVAMRKTQEQFAKAAALANERQKATNARFLKTRKIMEADRREAAKNLRLAVKSWQKTTAAWAASANAKIDQSNKHVAANAAQIRENAKKAAKDLQNTMASWNHKIAKFTAGEKAANSKLGRQFYQQNKATRQWAVNKINSMVAGTAAQFHDVETKMAKNRHEVDMALKQAVMRVTAALNAQKALEDKRYAQTVRNIAAARKEAADKVKAATTEFKLGLMVLRSSVNRQVTKVNNRIDDAAGVVRKNKAAQAKVNANVNAEMKRMIKLGNKRYKKHLKDDAELQRLINKRQAETTRNLNRMADSFNQQLRTIRSTMARDRKHAESQLQKKTGAVYAALAKQEAAQRRINAALEAQTRRMKLDAMDAVRATSKAFRGKISNLGKVVDKSDKAAEKKIANLLGVVKANAVKSAKGRRQLAIIEQNNRNVLAKSIRDAITKGEKRAQLVEFRGKKMDKDTQWLINADLKAKIAKLKDSTSKQVDALRMESAKAREQLMIEMKYAVKSAASVAKKNLEGAIRDGVKKMEDFQKMAAAAHKASAADRAAIQAKIKSNAKAIAREIKAAVLGDAKAKTAFAEQTNKSIKGLNNRVDAYAARMKAITKKNRALLKAQSDATLRKIQAEEARAGVALGKFAAKDLKYQKLALAFLGKELKKAEKDADSKFGKAYQRLARERAAFDRKLGAATNELNMRLAKQAALATGRFRTTVKNIAKARKEAADQVKQLRKDFATSLMAVNAESKRVNQRLVSEIAVVTGEVATMKANQILVNNRVTRELRQVERVADKRFSEAKRARGRLKKEMDDFKKSAAAEVKALQVNLLKKIEAQRARNARMTQQMARDLSAASKKLYTAMAAWRKSNAEKSLKLTASTSAAAAASKSALKRAKTMFATKTSTLSNLIASNYKRNVRDMKKITGVVEHINKANAADRKNINARTKVMTADFNKRLVKAIATGEARAKAIEQRLKENLKRTVRTLRVELATSLDRMADATLAAVSKKRKKIADNYLSLKAYAVAAADKVVDYTAGKNGRNLSSIGDMLRTVGMLGAVKAPKAKGLGMGGSTIPSVFSSKKIKVKNSVAAVHGLVNEYVQACRTVRANWPLGLGKYLMDRLETSMLGKGVLQVDKVAGKSGHYVYMNGRSVGLSSKLNDFASLASRMSVYEAVLSKLTAKLPTKTTKKIPNVPPPVWQGN